MLPSHITNKIKSVGQITILDNAIEGNHGRYSHHRGLWPSSVQIHPPAPWDEQAVLPTLCWQVVTTDSDAAPDFRLQNTCFTQRPYNHLGRTAKLIRSFVVRQFGADHLGRKVKQIVQELTATERRMPSPPATVVRGAGRKLEDLSAVRRSKIHLLATKKGL